MQRILLALALCCSLLAQRGGRSLSRQGAQAPQVKPEDACTVEGRVLNGASGEPLNKATVRLRRADAGARGYTGGTDASGRFVITGVAPGTYRLSVARNGFVDAQLGSRDPRFAGETFTLSPKQRKNDVVVSMIPHGVLTGRVLDQDGEPINGLTVQALRYRYPQGRKQLAASGDSTTNDIGEYRIYGLPPGRYYLAVSPRRYFERSAQPDEEYVPTYYPGATDAASAAPIDIAPGTQLRGLDLTLSKRRTFHVSGRVTDASGSSGSRVMLALRPRGTAVYSSSGRGASLDGGGNFDIAGVPPGAYTLTAALLSRGRALAARVPVDVGSGNVENVSIVISPALTLSGRVIAEGQTAPASFSGMQVSLRVREPGIFGGPPSARVQPDGSYSFTGVSPDEYDLTVSGLPEGYYLKAVLANGQNVLFSGFDLARAPARSVDLVLAPGAGQVSGVVLNNKQEPESGATVVLIPQEQERKALAQFYGIASTDGSGRFMLRNLNPGQYKAYGWSEVESGAWYDPDFLRPVENEGESVNIREGAREDVKVRMIR